ncbi:MAG: (d)CMP kinase [Cyclobacteriaceae bacterium]
MSKKIIIAIDGYSACGKSTTAKKVAAEIGYSYIDSGAMYRAVTLYFLDNYIKITDPNAVSSALKKITIGFRFNQKTKASDTYLNDLNVEKEIRTMRVTQKVSEVAALSSVRRKLGEQQQQMGKSKGIVMDGRDIGTHIFPDAELKIFMSADIDVRAHRRQKELLYREKVLGIDEILENLKKRDHIDSTRKDNPLVQSKDAVVIDTSDKEIHEQVAEVVGLARIKMSENEA